MSNSKLPYISVIIIAYKRKEFLLNAIKSVVNQTLETKYYQIIVIKNFTDNTIDNYIKNKKVIGIVSSEEGINKAMKVQLVLEYVPIWWINKEFYNITIEVIKAKKIEYIIQELALKVVNYNIMRGMTHAY